MNLKCWMVPGIRLSMLMVISAEPKRAVTRFGKLLGKETRGDLRCAASCPRPHCGMTLETGRILATFLQFFSPSLILFALVNEFCSTLLNREYSCTSPASKPVDDTYWRQENMQTKKWHSHCWNYYRCMFT